MLTKRMFIPGSEWLYFKIYVGSTYADKILVHELTNFISKINRKKIIQKWFFIRYSDPEYHLRIRFLLKEDVCCGEVINLLCRSFQKYVRDEIVWKIQIDTYTRELERYKVNLMEYGESLFHIDSTYILCLLRMSTDNKWSEQKRLLIGIRMIDQYLDAFGYNIERKQEILKRMNQSFKSEFGYNKFNAKQLNGMYRENSRNLDAEMKEKNGDTEKLLIRRLKAIRNISKLIQNESTDYELDSLLPSYIHMMMNRWFCSKNRLYELLSYNFLNRYYRSMVARKLI